MISKIFKNQKTYFIVGGFWLIAGLLIFPLLVKATPYMGLDLLENTGLSDEDPKVVIVNIIKILLSFLTIAAGIVILFAGFKWMTAGGNEEKITSAKKLLTNAIIGLVIILTSYAIVRFVVSTLLEASAT